MCLEGKRPRKASFLSWPRWFGPRGAHGRCRVSAEEFSSPTGGSPSSPSLQTCAHSSALLQQRFQERLGVRGEQETLEIEDTLQAVDVRIGLANLLQLEKPGNSAKIANVKVVTANQQTLTVPPQIHENFRKHGVGVRDDIAILTLDRDVHE